MGITRLYTGEDGQTHIEELDLASHPELTSLMTTKGVVFRSTAPGHFSDWHTAPRGSSSSRWRAKWRSAWRMAACTVSVQGM